MFRMQRPLYRQATALLFALSAVFLQIACGERTAPATATKQAAQPENAAAPISSPDLAIASGGRLAWVMRKNNPQLKIKEES